MHVLLTWISGKEFCQSEGVQIFINSLNKSGYKGHKVVFTTDMEESFEKSLVDMEYEVAHVNCVQVLETLTTPREQYFALLRNRWQAYYNYLNSHSFDKVVITDSKDVIFQRNISDYLEKIERGIVVCSEGVTHQESQWNLNEQALLQLAIKKGLL